MMLKRCFRVRGFIEFPVNNNLDWVPSHCHFAPAVYCPWLILSEFVCWTTCTKTSHCLYNAARSHFDLKILDDVKNWPAVWRVSTELMTDRPLDYRVFTLTLLISSDVIVIGRDGICGQFFLSNPFPATFCLQIWTRNTLSCPFFQHYDSIDE